MSIHSQINKIVGRLDLQLNRAAQEIMEETRQKLRDSIDALFYKTYSPKDYIRSYELIDSVNGKIIKNGQGNYTVEVFFDAELMSSRPNLHNWGTHRGWDNSDFRQGLIESIIHGIGGSDNNPRKGTSTDVIEVVQQEAEKYANSILKKYL